MKIIRRSCRSDTWEYLHTCACLESRRFLKFWEQRPLTPKFWSNCSPSKGRLSTTYNRFSLWQSFCIYHFTWPLALTLCMVQSRMVSYPLMTLALHSSKLHLKSTLPYHSLVQNRLHWLALLYDNDNDDGWIWWFSGGVDLLHWLWEDLEHAAHLVHSVYGHLHFHTDQGAPLFTLVRCQSLASTFKDGERGTNVYLPGGLHDEKHLWKLESPGSRCEAAKAH